MEVEPPGVVQLLIRAWEEAVEGAIEDGLLFLDEENALSGNYPSH